MRDRLALNEQQRRQRITKLLAIGSGMGEKLLSAQDAGLFDVHVSGLKRPHNTVKPSRQWLLLRQEGQLRNCGRSVGLEQDRSGLLVFLPTAAPQAERAFGQLSCGGLLSCVQEILSAPHLIENVENGAPRSIALRMGSPADSTASQASMRLCAPKRLGAQCLSSARTREITSASG